MKDETLPQTLKENMCVSDTHTRAYRMQVDLHTGYIQYSGVYACAHMDLLMHTNTAVKG